MKRLFIPLYLIVVATFLVVATLIDPFTELIMGERLHQYYDRTTSGLFYLLTEKLENVDPSERRDYLKRYNAEQRGYPLLVLERDDKRLSQRDWRGLLQGHMEIFSYDDAEYYVRWLPASNFALAITYDDSERAVQERDAIQHFTLIFERLVVLPRDDWDLEVATINEHFGLPLNIVNFTDLELSDDELARVQTGRIVATHSASDDERYYAQLPDGSGVLAAGPLQAPVSVITLMGYVFGSVLAIMAIAIALWLRPLWRSVRELERATETFGGGDMKARADIRPTAALGDLAGHFNAMAARIRRLINGHRELTNAVSHELRTPIARMRFGLEMLSSARSEEDRKRHSNSLSGDVDDLENLVNEILSYARYEQQKPNEALEQCALAPWLENIIEDARRFGDGKQLSFNGGRENVDITVSIRPRVLRRAIDNILRNACRYGSHVVQMNLKVDLAACRIEIDDDGPGIPAADRGTIFEPFARLDASRDKATGGHGLGLAIARECMRVHGGDISVTTGPLGGARFILTWPRH